MAKRKTPEEKLDLPEKTFTTMDGRELQMAEYFKTSDFSKSDDGEQFVKHTALLRVASQVFNITFRDAEIRNQPSKQNDWCSVVKVVYKVRPKLEGTNPEGDELHYSAVADCRTGNAMFGNEKYSTTVAETRASARCLRNLLGVDFCSREEIDEQTEGVEADDAPAKPRQIMVVERKFMGEHGVTMDEINKILAKKWKDKFKDNPIKQLEELTQNEIAHIISYLHRYLDNLKAKREEG